MALIVLNTIVLMLKVTTACSARAAEAPVADCVKLIGNGAFPKGFELENPLLILIQLFALFCTRPHVLFEFRLT